MLNIERDHGRFKEIVKGNIRKNLKEFISSGSILGRRGKDKVSVNIPQIDTPRFKYGSKQSSGVGQGDGQPGDSLGGDPQQQEGAGQAGQDPGDHALEVDIKIEELAQILGEELELPNIQPRGRKNISSTKEKYSSIRQVGPHALRHFRRTYREALLRQLVVGSYDKDNPVIIPIRDDMRFRSWKNEKKPETNAVIIYMMDVSGSMGDEQKEIVRIESFWLDTWLRSQYQGLDTRYIIHDAVAREVDRETFFHTRESGGTMISSAYKLCADIIAKDYPVDEWNIYPFHFSDGDNWSLDDTDVCMNLLRDTILKASNTFCYGQVVSAYGSGQFIKDLREHFGEHDQVVLSEIAGRDAIMQSIKDFLGTGQ
jgi:sporulation protein YhbH